MRMPPPRTHTTLHGSGFVLAELLVTLVASLVVASAVMVYAVSAVRSNAQAVAGAKLMQNLRHSLDVVTGEIRRAGYYDDAARYAPAAQSERSNMPIMRSPSCIVVQYDLKGPVFHGYRHAEKNGVGVIQAASSRGFEPDCTATGGTSLWKDITDPATINVLEFSFSPVAGVSGCTNVQGFAVIGQDIDVHVKARLTGNATVERSLAEAMRVRNDIMASGSCT